MNNQQTDIDPAASEFTIRSGILDDFQRIEPLWVALYKNQHEQGMLVDVPPNGFESWRSSMSVAYGRFTSVFIAERGHELIGFLAGRIRTMPPYFGGHPVGFLSEIFILKQYRKKGIARRLMLAGLEWCRSQGVTRVEGQVLMDNEASRKMCADLGAVEELVQVVWNVGT